MLRQIKQISEENPKPQMQMLRYKPDSLVLLNIGVLLCQYHRESLLPLTGHNHCHYVGRDYSISVAPSSVSVPIKD